VPALKHGQKGETMALTRKSPEVFLADGPIITLGRPELDRLREAVGQTPKRRARINAHPDSSDALHEMIIAIERNSYIRPHKHPGKSEAFHIIEGDVDIVVFDDTGEICKIVPLSALGERGGFYYRMSDSFFHTLVIRCELLIVHEITNGPFCPEATVFAAFAPPEADLPAAAHYRSELERRADGFTGISR
jgi:cupin fold WbuC family metalloprotein